MIQKFVSHFFVARIPSLSLLVLSTLCGIRTEAAELPVSIIKLPPLRIEGRPATAHTQGLELISENFYITARREDVQPKRALLVRTSATRTDWDVWDITPPDPQSNSTALDHPGGTQSDGDHFWIPVAESQRNGRTFVCRYSITTFIPGQPLEPKFEFAVNDHIGALAVWTNRNILIGANWDTQKVYVWDYAGRLQRTLTSADLARRSLGVVSAPEAGQRAGLAVQDWKFVDNRLFASGLFRGPGNDPAAPQSRLISFARFFESNFQPLPVPLPKQNQIELAHEAMAVADGFVYFLPEDLGATNRVYRISLENLMKQPAAVD